MSSSTDKLSSPFTLYYGHYSMYSTIVRTTFALRGPVRSDGRPEMIIEPSVIDISPGITEQLSSNYLCNINPNGLVPALANKVLFTNPMVESTNISWYIAEWYPQLLPAEHESEIREFVGELHQINAGVLTMGPGGKVIPLLLEKTRTLLKQEDITGEYRDLLVSKEKQLEKRLGRMTTETLDEATDLTKKFLPKVQALMEKHNDGTSKNAYIFGQQPTVLDAHVLVFLCRLYDLGKTDLIPDELLKWVEGFRQGEVWKKLMENVPGGKTLPPGT